jgi:2'-5' RNA ligase
MRSFIAIDIPTELRDALGSIQEELRVSGADVRWVRPQSVHLTLKFLGEIDPEVVKGIYAEIEKCIRKRLPFTLELAGMGCFPRLRQPRVVWVGLLGETERLLTLQKEVEEGAARLSFPREQRPFKPHLTLGRVRSAKGRERLIDHVQRLLNVHLGSFTVRSVVQYKSELHPAGARYTPLWEMPFAGSGAEETGG